MVIILCVLCVKFIIICLSDFYFPIFYVIRCDFSVELIISNYRLNLSCLTVF